MVLIYFDTFSNDLCVVLLLKLLSFGLCNYNKKESSFCEPGVRERVVDALTVCWVLLGLARIHMKCRVLSSVGRVIEEISSLVFSFLPSSMLQRQPIH